MTIISRSDLIYAPAPCLEQLQQVYQTYVHALTHNGYMGKMEDIVPGKYVGLVAYMCGYTVAEAANLTGVTRQALTSKLTTMDRKVTSQALRVDLSQIKWKPEFELEYIIGSFDTYRGNHLLEILPETFSLTVMYETRAFESTVFEHWPAISSILRVPADTWRFQVKTIINEMWW